MNTINATRSMIENDEIDLLALLKELTLHKWLILILILCSLTVAFLYTRQQIPHYQSDVLLQMDSGKSSMSKSGLFEQLAMGSVSTNSAAIETALIQSRFILEPVIDELHLDISLQLKRSIWNKFFYPKNKSTYKVEVFNVSDTQLNKKFTLKRISLTRIQLLNKHNKIMLEGELGQLLKDPKHLIELKINKLNAPIGTAFVLIKHSKAKVVKVLLKQLKIDEAGDKRFASNTGILNIRLTGTNPKQIVDTLNTIASIAKIQDAKRKAEEASQTLNFLTQQLPTTKKQLEDAESELNLYRAKSGKIDIKLQTQALINRFAELDKELGKLRIEKINMQQQYTAAHPMLIATNTQIKSLEVQRKELEQTLKVLPSSDQIAVNLLRDVKVKKTLYLVLLRKIQELQVIQAGTISNLHILAFAKMPDAPLPTKNIFIYTTSTLLGLFLGIFIILGRQFISSKIYDPNWSEKEFDLPNLAIISYCKEQKHNLAQFDSTIQVPLLAHIDPKNLAIESLRSLRTSLQVSLVGANNNIISILGITPGVGKSFISANLAYLIASMGKKTLLIDADMRRGTIHKYMGVAASPGLSEVLNETVALDKALTSTLHENLTCLPRGNHPTDPSELLIGQRFKTLTQTITEQFDVVIIDTAPILLVTDAVIVSGLTGINYLVLGAGEHQPNEFEIALKRLQSAGVNLHGSIFNYTKQQAKKRMQHQYGNSYASYYAVES